MSLWYVLLALKVHSHNVKANTIITNKHTFLNGGASGLVLQDGFHSGNRHRILDFFPSCITTIYHVGCGSHVRTATESWYGKPDPKLGILRKILVGKWDQ